MIAALAWSVESAGDGMRGEKKDVDIRFLFA
jgi:hypothetical protein